MRLPRNRGSRLPPPRPSPAARERENHPALPKTEPNLPPLPKAGEGRGGGRGAPLWTLRLVIPEGPGARLDVPWVTTMRMTPYMLATSPMPDYFIERKITWDDRWWPSPDHLFVLRQQASGTSPSTGGRAN